jgi:DNA-binding transcriptional MocR family regulator
MITSGANQGLDIIFRAMNLGTRVLVEQPTYDMVIDIARMCGIELFGIPRSESGLNLHLLESAFQTCDFFYTIPRLSNPSGYSYTEAQKKKIAELACKYHVMIIEDDYLGDMIPAGRDFPIYYYGMGEYNIYIKSFSKGFLPGIRLGAVVFSNNKKYESFWQKCIEVKKLTDYGTSIYSQGALETFIHSGMYQRHLNKIQAAYPERMNKIRRFLDNKKSEKISWYIPNNGIFITMTIKCNKSSGWVDRQLKLHGINAKALSVFFLSEISDKTNITFRLCVTALPLDKVYEGLSRINQIFD